MKILNIRHSGFSVKNEEKALSFYRDLLGFKVVKKDKEHHESHREEFFQLIPVDGEEDCS